MATKKRKAGRPRKTTSEINPVRQVGRWSDEAWARIEEAAKKQARRNRQRVNVAGWCKERLIPAAEEELAN